MDMSLARYLRCLGACGPAIAWAVPISSLQVAWSACTNPAWMMWLLARHARHLSADHPDCRRVVRASLACAKTTLPFLSKPKHEQLLEIMAPVQAWSEGEDVQNASKVLDRKNPRYAPLRVWGDDLEDMFALQAFSVAVGSIRSPYDGQEACALAASCGPSRQERRLLLAHAIRNAVPQVKEIPVFTAATTGRLNCSEPNLTAERKA